MGGGIAGLAAAHRFLELRAGAPLELVLLEAAPRLGGTIRTERPPGYVLDAGPDSLLAEKPWGLGLAERLGLGARLRGSDERVRRTYVVRQGRLVPLPEGFVLLAPARIAPVLRSPVFSWRGKLRMGLDLVLPRRRAAGDDSLGAFVRRRLGREVLERVVQPLAAGIYTADPDRLSLAATMPRFLALEREHRSLILGLRRGAAHRPASGAGRGRWSLFVTLAGGMEELVEALAARLPPGSVRLGSLATAVVRADGGWRVALGDGEVLPADALVLAGPADRMAALVRETDPPLARELAAIDYASSAAVALAYPRRAVRHPLDAFGYVVPRHEGAPVVACTFLSAKYPGRAPAEVALFRVFLGGALDPGLLERDDAALVALARGELAARLGIDAAPSLTRVWRHPRAMPQYDVGHLGRVAAIEARLDALPGLAVAGAAYRGVGIADCVRSGEAAAERLAPRLGGGPS